MPAFNKLADIQYISSSVASIYANPSGYRSAIKTLLVHNTNINTETIEIYCVPDSNGTIGTATSAHRIFKIPLATNESYEISLAYPIILSDTNDSIQAQTTTNSKVTILVNGDIENV